MKRATLVRIAAGLAIAFAVLADVDAVLGFVAAPGCPHRRQPAQGGRIVPSTRSPTFCCTSMGRRWFSPAATTLGASKAPLELNKSTWATNESYCTSSALPEGTSSRTGAAAGLVQIEGVGRRSFIVGAVSCASMLSTRNADAAVDAAKDLQGARNLLIQAQQQLAPVPDLIRDEKWDSVRAVLLKPPLQELWSNKGNNAASAYVDLVGQQGGDELEALELRETLSSHLRYLDMAVYNNVFNPITSQGKTGASAELIRSYYEDPTNEYSASLSALLDLIALSDEL